MSFWEGWEGKKGNKRGRRKERNKYMGKHALFWKGKEGKEKRERRECGEISTVLYTETTTTFMYTIFILELMKLRRPNTYLSCLAGVFSCLFCFNWLGQVCRCAARRGQARSTLGTADIVVVGVCLL